jgi:hypothetical protein
MGTQTGPRGRRGATGPKGARGPQGTPGLVGPTGDAGDVLEIVEKQIDDIHRELAAQMKRIAQLQHQLDELRATVRRAIPPGGSRTDPPTS